MKLVSFNGPEAQSSYWYSSAGGLYGFLGPNASVTCPQYS